MGSGSPRASGLSKGRTSAAACGAPESVSPATASGSDPARVGRCSCRVGLEIWPDGGRTGPDGAGRGTDETGDTPSRSHRSPRSGRLATLGRGPRVPFCSSAARMTCATGGEGGWGQDGPCRSLRARSAASPAARERRGATADAGRTGVLPAARPTRTGHPPAKPTRPMVGEGPRSAVRPSCPQNTRRRIDLLWTSRENGHK